jgi:putative membrane protein
MRTVPRKIRESVEKRETFVPLSALFTEKVSDGLIFIGGTGITAFLVLFDRSIGSDTRGAINAIVTPFVPAVLLFAVYVFSIDLLRGYYLFKYSEQYREQFGYSVKDWYGEKSKEYKRTQNKLTE